MLISIFQIYRVCSETVPYLFYVDMLYMLARFDDSWTAELSSFKSFLMRPCINEALAIYVVVALKKKVHVACS